MSFIPRRTRKKIKETPVPEAKPASVYKSKPLVDLGELYLSDFVSGPDDYEGKEKYPLQLVMDEKVGAARLANPADPDKMFGKYWYRSGTTASMKAQLKEIAEEVSGRIKYSKGDVWLDIACNDGTMFRYMPEEFVKLGIDPCSSYKEFHDLADGIAEDYFSKEAYKAIRWHGDKKCKVITCIAMFYDLDDPAPFLDDIYSTLEDDGIFVIQMAYAPLMLKQMAFDNICHEHVYYHSLKSMKTLLENHNFKIVDCSLNETNGGSYRMYVQKKGAKITSFATAPLRDVCDFRVESLLDYEELDKSCSDTAWIGFSKRLKKLKEETVDFIRHEVKDGKTVYGYGASTKGNTLLQYFGLGPDDITAIAERAPEKFGMYTVGTNIPIISEEEMRAAKPDYLFVLPWHFIKEFVEREEDYLKEGGKFIVPCPKFEVIGYNG
jgi:SAM-dependent methyltransferase